MFFRARTKKSSSRQARYGRGVVLTSRASRRSNTRAGGSGKSIISNLSLPSLTSIKRVLLAMIAIGILGAGTYFIWFSGFFKITKIYVQYEEFQNENSDILTYFDDIKGKNYLFTDPTQKNIEIQKAHPELSKLIVQKIFPDTVKISFTEFPITANVESIVNGKSTEKVLINSIGMIIYRDTENPNLPYIKVITKNEDDEPAAPITPSNPDATTTPSPVTTPTPATTATPAPTAPAPTAVAVVEDSSPVISSSNLTYMLNAASSFEERFGMKITEMQLLPQAREFHFKTEKNFEIWLDIQIPFEKQFLKLKKAMATLDIYKTPLFYIDLRVSGANGEKVIFKRKK